MIDDEIKRLRALCDAATPGPWLPPEQRDGSWAPDDSFVAAARTALPDALDEIERLRAEIAELKRDRDR